MSGDGFNKYEARASESVATAKPDLDLVLFGPYSGMCSHVLEEIASQLRRNDYDSVRVCSEYPDPDRTDDMTDDEYNWIRSVKCLEESEFAAFVFMEAFESRFPGYESVPNELNSSVSSEFTYWSSRLRMSPERTLVVYEGDISENLGSLIPGQVDNLGCHEGDFNRRDYSELFEIIDSACWTWTNKYCK